MTLLVTFDIADEDHRGQLVRYLARLGKRIARSLYAVSMRRHEIRKFRAELEKLAGEEGTVVVLRLCTGCERSARTLEEKTGSFIIV